MVRISLNLTDEQAAALQERAAQTHVIRSEQIRIAIDNFLALPASRVLNAIPKQPVLFVQKASE